MKGMKKTKPPPHIEVDNADEAFEKAKQLGRRVLSAPKSVVSDRPPRGKAALREIARSLKRR